MKMVSLLALATILGCAGALTRADEPAPRPAVEQQGQPGASAPAPYDVATSFVVGGEQRWDYITVDAAARRIYLGHASRVTVLDADKGTVLGEVTDLGGVHGAAVAPAAGTGFASVGRAGEVCVFDLKTFTATGKVKAGENPDAIIYDPASQCIFAFNGKSGDISVINPAKLDQPAQTIAVGGKLEYAVADGQGHVYANVEDKAEIVAIDAKAMKIDGRWSIAPGEEPTGLTMDVKNRRLFSGCRNQMVVVLNADTGKVVATPAIGQGCDGVAFDAAAGLVISANGRDGTVTVIAEKDPQTYAVIATIPTVKSARTVAIDEQTHHIYLPCLLPPKGDAKAEFGVLVLQPTPKQ